MVTHIFSCWSISHGGGHHERRHRSCLWKVLRFHLRSGQQAGWRHICETCQIHVDIYIYICILYIYSINVYVYMYNIYISYIIYIYIIYNVFYIYIYKSGWWFQPLWKYESQLGVFFPIHGKIKMFQTTNQKCICVHVCVCAGRGCCLAKGVLSAQGQSFLHVGMSVKWQLGWRDLFPKHKTLNPKY